MRGLSERRWQQFRANRRAFQSLFLLIGIMILALLAPVIANDKPIIMRYQGQMYLPLVEVVRDDQLGGSLPTEADYHDGYTKQHISQNGWMVMPLIPWSYDTIDYGAQNVFPAAPDKRHWLGTDDQGRDILARLLYGLRLSLLFGISLTFCSALVGILVGAIQGYFGGKTDLILGRFLEIWGSLPQLFILIIVSSLIVPGFGTLLCILLFFSWTTLVPVVRAEFLKTRQLEYVQAARVLGVSDRVIMFRHILPNALVATVAYLPFMLSGAVVALSALDFLGLGLPAGTPSLGDMIRQGKENLQAPWIGLTIFVTLTIVLSALLFVGEGVRDALDPHREEAP